MCPRCRARGGGRGCGTPRSSCAGRARAPWRMAAASAASAPSPRRSSCAGSSRRAGPVRGCRAATPCRRSGPDATPRRADLKLAELRLALLIEQLVVGHDQVRVRRDARAADVDPLAAQVVDLGRQDLRVDDHAVADRAQLAGIEDPRRDQVNLKVSSPTMMSASHHADGITGSACSASSRRPSPSPRRPTGRRLSPVRACAVESRWERRAGPNQAPGPPCAGPAPGSVSGRRRSP